MINIIHMQEKCTGYGFDKMSPIVCIYFYHKQVLHVHNFLCWKKHQSHTEESIWVALTVLFFTVTNVLIYSDKL